MKILFTSIGSIGHLPQSLLLPHCDLVVCQGYRPKRREKVPMIEATIWPRKTRELRHRIIDSRIWNEFTFRDDDIVIAT